MLSWVDGILALGHREDAKQIKDVLKSKFECNYEGALTEYRCEVHVTCTCAKTQQRVLGECGRKSTQDTSGSRPNTGEGRW